MHSSAETSRENKMQAASGSSSVKAAQGRAGLQLKDNRPSSVLQRKQVDALDTRETDHSATVQRLEIANIASGTDKETLMHSQAPDHNVTNIDTGHMVIADAIIKANDPAVWGIIAAEVVSAGVSVAFPGVQKLAGRTRTQWLTEQMVGDPSVGAARLKQLLGAKPGLRGAYELYHLLPDPLKYSIVEQLQMLDDFKLGDLGTFAEQSVKKGGTDVVHIVNALGFDPIGDPTQAVHLATGIKPGGLLIITAEATGQSVSSLIPKQVARDPEKLNGFLKGGAAETFSGTPLGRYFVLSSEVMHPQKSKVMSMDRYTAELETRHTIQSGSSTEMQDNIPTVQLRFTRNETKVEEG